jgi:hypothetical protein
MQNMRKTVFNLLFLWPGRLAGGILLCAVLIATSAAHAQTVPSDPEVACSVSNTTINGWFKSGMAMLDGVVNPANSVSFPNTPNCSFYEWSYHMFLWLTSISPPIYGGGGGRIFESSAFFDVSPLDGGKRTLTPHSSGLVNKLATFAKQVGRNRLPLVVDKQGRIFEVQPPPRLPVSPRIKASSGQLVEISRAQIGDNGQLILLDKAGRRITPSVLAAPPERSVRVRELRPANARRARKFLINGISIFVDLAGNLIEVEQGMADGSVLIAQNGSPIYYGIAVNEVMAYFRTMQGSTVPSTLMFPTTQGELDTVTNFAAAHGRTFVDPEALAFEVKTSWIEAAGLANPDDFITMTADIPTYDKSNPLHWVKNGHKNAKVALVGMHVVGSAAGHPEMIWATFEHVGNTPNDAYSYRDSMGGIKPIVQDTSGNWVFAATNSTTFSGAPHQIISGDDIVAFSPPTPIGPDNIIRRKAWGAASDVSPNPLKGTPASNSEIISVNNSVRAVLAAGDVRRNYIVTGSTWMIAGQFPFTSFNTTEVGTSKLNNSTMETFTEGTNTLAASTFNCFTCHGGGKTTSVSHVFSDLKPLF